jgi:hypothetical protein
VRSGALWRQHRSRWSPGTRLGCTLVLCSTLTGAGAAAGDDDKRLTGELIHCIEGAAAVQAIDPAMVPKLVARDCPFACPGLARYAESSPGQDWRALGEQCDLFCSSRARASFETAPPARRWAALAEACGTDYYGLPAGQGGLLSDVWFVFQRVGRWLQHANTVAGPDSRRALADLAQTLLHDRFVLPLPVTLAGRYELPLAKAGFNDIQSRDYLLIGGDTVSYGLIPEATLTVDRGAQLRSRFPGEPIPIGQLATRRAPLRTPPAQISSGGRRGILSPPPSLADKTMAVVRRNGPLLLADKQLPAARVVQILEALGEDGASLAVTDGHGGAGLHSVLLTARPIEIGAPTVHLTIRDAFGPLGAQRPPVVWLNVGTATVAQLVDALNALYDGGVRLVVFEHSNVPQ